MRGLILALIGMLVAVVSVRADDWPQWLGPQQDGVWREDGVVERLPEGGPAILWRAPISFGYAGPSVVGDRVYVADFVKESGDITNNPGGRDKLSGKERWRAISGDEPGYCPPSMIQHGGRRQLLVWHPKGIHSLDPTTGEIFWAVEDVRPDYGMSISIPRLEGDHLFVSAHQQQAAMLKLSADPLGAEIVWRGKPKTALYAGTSTPFIDAGVIYGCDANSGALIAARLADGERIWQTTEPTLRGGKGRYGTVFLTRHRDRYFGFNELGELTIATLSPEGYQEHSRAKVIEPTNKVFGRTLLWAAPAFAHQRAFVRNDQELICVDLAAP